MGIFFMKVLMWMQLGFSKLVDNIFGLFNVFAGIEGVDIKDGVKDESLLMYFITNDSVVKVFWYIMVIGTFMAFVFTVIAVIKNMVIGKKAMGAIVAKLGVSIVSMVLIVMVIFLGIFGVNVVLQEIDVSFNIDNELTVGQRLFESAVPEEAWEIKDNGERYSMADLVEKDDKGNPKWKEGVNADMIFGVRKKSYFFEDSGKVYDQEQPPPMIDIQEYNFFISFPAVIILGVVVFMAVMSLVARLFNIVFLLLTSPLIMATLPLDDGAKFKLWRESFISKAVIAYGTVFAVNIYIIMLPLISKITIPGASQTMNSIMHMFLIICGALTISTGQLLFSSIMGSSAEESRQGAHGFRNMFLGLAGTAAAAGTAAKLVFKGAGAVGAGAYKTGRGIVNTGAKAFTGGYKGGKLSDNVKETVKSKLSGASNKWNEDGGILGKMQKHKDLTTPTEPPEYSSGVADSMAKPTSDTSNAFCGPIQSTEPSNGVANNMTKPTGGSE